MIEHIKQLGERLVREIDENRGAPFATLQAFQGEVNDLDRMDFAPDARADFLITRNAFNRVLQAYKASEGAMAKEYAVRLLKLLDKFGPLAQPAARKFLWLKDSDLQKIVERDYIELSKLLMPSGAWKSVVIMAGSITEAILFDLLTKDATRLSKAKAAPSSKDKKGNPIPEDNWKLHQLIKIATEIGLIDKDRSDTFDQVLRDYRNFVHPLKEVRAAHACGEGEAYMAKGAVDALCDHFDRTKP